MEVLLSLIGPYLGKLVALFGMALGALWFYFFAKNKGAQQEQAKQAEAKAKIQVKVTEAVSNDAKVDAKVAAQKAKIQNEVPPKRDSDSYPVGSDFKF